MQASLPSGSASTQNAGASASDRTVPHDEAHERIAAALAAGGTVRSDAEAPAFWVLADPEGNEACITTWQGRD